MRAKAWAFQNGHIKADGRGRMPKVSIKTGQSITTVLTESGVKFSDWPKGEIVTTVNEETQVVESKVKRDVTQTGFLEPVEFLYPETQYKAVEIESKKIRSMRSACYNCGVSLVVCWCGEPSIVSTVGIGGRVRVNIVRM